MSESAELPEMIRAAKNLWVFQESPMIRCVVTAKSHRGSMGVNGAIKSMHLYIYIYSPMVEGVNWGAFFGKSTKSTRTIPEEKHWH